MPTPVRGARRATGRPQTDSSTITVRIDNSRARSDYTIHIEHPSYDRGVRCFHRSTRGEIVAAIQRHIHARAPAATVDVVHDADLGLTPTDLAPPPTDDTAVNAGVAVA